MALVNNGVRIGGGPFKSLGAARVIVIDRAKWGVGGELRNFTAGDADEALSPLAGRPWGYRHPAAWVWPQKAGALVSYLEMAGLGTLDASITDGRNLDATLSGSGTLTATGSLVVSGTATLTGSGSLTATGVGVLNGTATLSGSGSLSANIGALAWATATLAGSGSLSATLTAKGWMSAALGPVAADNSQILNAIADSTATTAANINGAVVTLTSEIGAITVDPNDISDHLLDIELVEAGITLRQALRALLAVAAGRTARTGDVVTIRDVGNTKARITATVVDGLRQSVTVDLT